MGFGIMEDLIKEICKYILEHLYDGITLEMLEQEFHYNRYYIMRLFKAYTGYTIIEFINTVKVLKTIDPLLLTDDTILKIALTNGFNSQEYYSEKFQNVIGTSPLRFRKEFGDLDTNSIDELEYKKAYLAYLMYQLQILNTVSTLDKIDKIKKIGAR